MKCSMRSGVINLRQRIMLAWAGARSDVRSCSVSSGVRVVQCIWDRNLAYVLLLCVQYEQNKTDNKIFNMNLQSVLVRTVVV